MTTPPAATISSGYNHACEIVSGKAYCWGDDSAGELGNNSTTQSNVPVAVYAGGVLSGVTLTQISAGTLSTCALSSAGAVYCWGNNNTGQLGNNSTTLSSSVPVAVTTAGTPMAGRTIVQVSADYYSACAVDSAGLVYCWGWNTAGQLGNNSTVQSNVPVAVTTAGTPMAGRTIVQVSTGAEYVCAVDSAGLVYCWGSNGNGELGNNSTANSSVPVAVTTAGTPMAGRTIAQVSAGLTSNVCAVDSAGLVYCWGFNYTGELGNNSTTQSLVPVAVTTAGTPMAGRTIAHVSAGDGFACAVDSAGLVYCWGYGSSGGLGNNSTANSSVPVAVTTAGTPMAGRTIAQVSAGLSFACAVDSAGLAYCWGNNTYGELGNNSVTQVNVPVAVSLDATAPGSVAAFGASGSAVVYWSASAAGTGTVTGYSVSASPGTSTCSTTTLSCTLTGLTNGTTYTVSVVATTTAGNSPAGTNTVTPWPPATISAGSAMRARSSAARRTAGAPTPTVTWGITPRRRAMCRYLCMRAVCCRG